jgi:hypothetical protein
MWDFSPGFSGLKCISSRYLSPGFSGLKFFTNTSNIYIFINLWTKY